MLCFDGYVELKLPDERGFVGAKMRRLILNSKTLIVGGLLLAGAMFASAQSSFHLVVNAKNDVSEIASSQTKDIYFGRKMFWDSGTKIRPALLNHKNSSTSQFLSVVLNTETSRFLAFWRRRLFSGRGVPPRQFSSEKELLEFVRQNEGAIAVISGVPKGDAAAQLKIIPISN